MIEEALSGALAQTVDAPLRVIVLDVGHGNCAIVQDGPEVAVIDAPKTLVLPLCLEMQASPTVRHLILSHADEDHIGGAQALLAHDTIRINELWINPNSRQHSKTFGDLVTAARDRFLSDGLRVSTNLNVGAGEKLSFGRVKIEILHPDIAYALTGPTDSKHPQGPISSNGMSSVLRISLSDRPAVFLPGDMDASAFGVLTSSGPDLATPVLVFPHHGGSSRTGSDQEFSARLCAAVRPELVVFSIGRRRYANPTPEVIAGIRDAVPQAHVACTQLSKRCNDAELGKAQFDHVLQDIPAAGGSSGLSCAGSIVVEWTSAGIVYRPLRTEHQHFIEAHVSTPLCFFPSSRMGESK